MSVFSRRPDHGTLLKTHCRSRQGRHGHCSLKQLIAPGRSRGNPARRTRRALCKGTSCCPCWCQWPVRSHLLENFEFLESAVRADRVWWCGKTCLPRLAREGGPFLFRPLSEAGLG